MRFNVFVFLIIFLAAIKISAQEKNDALIRAFSESYKQEALGKSDAAIGMMKAIYDEKSYEINLRMGWLHYLAGKYQDATSYYQKASDVLPASVEAKLGNVLPLAAMEKWDQVEKLYLEILAIDPHHSISNYRLGLIHYNKGKYDVATKYFQKVTDLYPFDYDGLHMLAWSYFKQGKMREAKVLFQKALLVRPGDKSATEGINVIK
jgi:tetratricopeptide (TPR) repeat protein